MNLETMTAAYLACALWASTGDDGEPLDKTLTVDDFAHEAKARAALHCAFFADRAGTWLDDWTSEQAGHDLWLTRNGHGSGFWDRGHAYGDVLADKAKAMGESDCYVGDDGRVDLT